MQIPLLNPDSAALGRSSAPRESGDREPAGPSFHDRLKRVDSGRPDATPQANNDRTGAPAESAPGQERAQASQPSGKQEAAEPAQTHQESQADSAETAPESSTPADDEATEVGVAPVVSLAGAANADAAESQPTGATSQQSSKTPEQRLHPPQSPGPNRNTTDTDARNRAQPDPAAASSLVTGPGATQQATQAGANSPHATFGSSAAADGTTSPTPSSEVSSASSANSSRPSAAEAKASSSTDGAPQQTVTASGFNGRSGANTDAGAENSDHSGQQDPSSEQRRARAAAASSSARSVTFEQAASIDSPAVARADEIDTSVRLMNQTSTGAAAPDGGPRAATLAEGARSGATPGASNSAASSSDRPGDLLASRVVRGMHAMLNHRGGSMVMRLDPPELGQLRLQMTVANGQVSASFEAQTAQTHALLKQNLAMLKTSLEAQGLSVERLTVQHAPAAHQSEAGGQQDRPSDQSARRHHDPNAGDGESRGRRDHDGSREQPHRRPRSFAASFHAVDATQMTPDTGDDS